MVIPLKDPPRTPQLHPLTPLSFRAPSNPHVTEKAKTFRRFIRAKETETDELCMEEKKRRKPALLQLMHVFFIINLGEVTNQRGSHPTGAMLHLDPKHVLLTEHVMCGNHFFDHLLLVLLACDHF